MQKLIKTEEFKKLNVGFSLDEGELNQWDKSAAVTHQ